MEWGKGAVRQASAAILIGLVVLIGNEGFAVAIPSRADIGMVKPVPSVEIFDACNHPQNMGPRLKTREFGGRERSAPVQGIIIIVGVGKERLGYFISWVWNGGESALLQQIHAMRNSHLKGRTSSGIPDYYFRPEGVSLFVGTDGDRPHPRPFVSVATFHNLRVDHHKAAVETKRSPVKRATRASGLSKM
jgi:hypothetical protein